MTAFNQPEANLIRDLYRYDLAWPALRALASDTMRYRDLVTTLATGGYPIYSRTLDNALRFLTTHGLAGRKQEQHPKQTTYHITELGRVLVTQLTRVEATVRHRKRTTSQPQDHPH